MRIYLPGVSNYFGMLEGAYVGIAPLVAAAIPSIFSGLKGLFGGHKKRKEEDQAYQERMRIFDQKVGNERSKRAILSGLARTYGADKMLPAGFLDTFSNFNPSRPMNTGGGGSMLGDFVGGAVGNFADTAFQRKPEGDLMGMFGGGGGGGGMTPNDGNVFKSPSAGKAAGAIASGLGGLFGGGGGAPPVSDASGLSAGAPPALPGGFGTGPSFGVNDLLNKIK